MKKCRRHWIRHCSERKKEQGSTDFPIHPSEDGCFLICSKKEDPYPFEYGSSEVLTGS